VATARSAPRWGSTDVLARQGRLSQRWLRENDHWAFAGLVALTLVAATLMATFSTVFTASVLMIPLLLTDLVLPPKRIPAFVTFVFVVLCVESVIEFRDDGIPPRRWAALVLVVMMALLLVAVAYRRNRLGVAGLKGDALLLDLQDRINRQGEVPDLPVDWHLDVATRSAGGTSFAGDFLVAHRDPGRRLLSLVLVDVSGKGVQAGTRSLLLSGAFGGLIGAVTPEEFLPAANGFLLRQDWDEGFATAVHLCLDLGTGFYEIRAAGHPPAIQFHAGAGRWQVQDLAEGPVLGLVPHAEFKPLRGRLGSGDVLMLYTDGLVEQPRRDIGLGIDRLIGEGERLLRTGFRDSAQGLVEKLGASADDCALAVVHRR
jgi:hypothetical protein